MTYIPLQLKLLIATVLMGVSSLVCAQTVEMDVNGLVCAFCAQGIEKTLKTFPATDEVFVSLENRIVAVHLKDGADIDDATLRKAIADSGYTVTAIRRSDESIDAVRRRVKAHD